MRAPARLLPAAALSLVVACDSNRAPTGVAHDSTAPRPQLSTAATTGRTYTVTVSADSSIYNDPDVGTVDDDFICDNSMVKARPTDPVLCSFRGAVRNHLSNRMAGNVIQFNVDSIRLSGPVFGFGGTVTIDGRGRGRVVVQGPWGAGGGNNVGLSLSVCNSLITGLLIRGFGGGGIALGSESGCSGGNRIDGNYIGTDRSGSYAVRPPTTAPNESGIFIASPNNVLQGNTIGGHRRTGVVIAGPSADRNVLFGNRIGIGNDPIAPMPNGHGVVIERLSGATGKSPSRNVIGAPGAAQGNLIIASADSSPVRLLFADSTRVEGNRLGVGDDVARTAHANRSAIVLLGNVYNGGGPQGNVIRLNTIGGSRSHGIDVSASVGNEVMENVVTGAGAAGIRVEGTGNVVAGNSVDGSGADGIALLNGSPTVWGGQVAGNTVVRSRGAGINAEQVQLGGIMISPGNRVEGNGAGGIILGSQASVSLNTVTGNAVAGVRVRGSRNSVASNTISGNAGPGVVVELPTAVRNSIRANALSGNGAPAGLGIDLGPAGVTPNDPSDADVGANDLQNFPVVTYAGSYGASVRMAGTLTSRPSGTYALDFHASSACDASGHGEAQTYLGTATVATDAAGVGSFNATLPKAVAVGSYVTATATDATGSTSELSACIRVVNDVSLDRRILFASDRHPPGWYQQLYIMNADGTGVQQLTTGNAHTEQPSGSPDRTRGAFASFRDGNWELYTLTLATGATTRLTNHPGMDGSPRWSPDGTRIAFISDRGGAAWPNQNIDVYVLTLATGAVARLTTTAGWDGQPAWSPDGKKLAFTNQGTHGYGVIYLHDVATGAATPLGTEGDASDPAWSPDGKKIAFMSTNYVSSGLALWTHDLATGARQQITAEIDPDWNMAPDWSPDGTSIVYERYDPTEGPPQIPRLHIRNLQTGSDTRLSPPGATYKQPAWRR